MIKSKTCSCICKHREHDLERLLKATKANKKLNSLFKLLKPSTKEQCYWPMTYTSYEIDNFRFFISEFYDTIPIHTSKHVLVGYFKVTNKFRTKLKDFKSV